MEAWVVKSPMGLVFCSIEHTHKEALKVFLKGLSLPWEWYEKNGYSCVKINIVEVGFISDTDN